MALVKLKCIENLILNTLLLVYDRQVNFFNKILKSVDKNKIIEYNIITERG